MVLFKDNKGITLAVLVVTIVVLLIIAGITISAITGGNSTMDKAKQAKDETAIKAEMEELQEVITKYASKGIRHGNFSGSADSQTIREALKKNNLIVENPDEVIIDGKTGWKVTGIKTGQKYVIKSDGSVNKYTSILPDSFQQVEYIESSGTQYITTNYIANEDIEVVCKYQFIISQSGDSMLFGFKNGNNVLEAEFFAHNRWYCACRNSGYRNVGSVGINSTNQYMANTLIINNKQFTATGTTYVQPNATYSVDNPIEMYILAWNSNGTAQYINKGARIYYLKITNDAGDCVANFIPCYSTENVIDAKGMECLIGTIGIYDIINKKFYTNQGSGDFLKGEDVY